LLIVQYIIIDKQYIITILLVSEEHMAQTYKVIIVGDRGVGKSSFVYQRLRGRFNPTYNPTFGVDTNSVTFYLQKIRK